MAFNKLLKDIRQPQMQLLQSLHMDSTSTMPPNTGIPSEESSLLDECFDNATKEKRPPTTSNCQTTNHSQVSPQKESLRALGVLAASSILTTCFDLATKQKFNRRSPSSVPRSLDVRPSLESTTLHHSRTMGKAAVSLLLDECSEMATEQPRLLGPSSLPEATQPLHPTLHRSQLSTRITAHSQLDQGTPSSDAGHQPPNDEELMIQLYREQCVQDVSSCSYARFMMLRGRKFYVVTSSLDKNSFNSMEHGPIRYRKDYCTEEHEKLRSHIIDTGPSDSFGTITITRTANLTNVVIDGVRRVRVYKDLMREGILGVGDVSPKDPSTFRWYLPSITVRVLVPCDSKAPRAVDLLTLSVALNGEESSATPLSDADVYVMLQQFIVYLYKHHGDHPISFYVNKTSEIVDMAIDVKLLDHLFSREIREKLITLQHTKRSTQASSSKKGRKARRPRRSKEEENQRDRYSKYLRASMSFIGHPKAFELVFNNFGLKCGLWNKELLCYQRFKDMDDTEMTVCLALLAKRHNEERRKAGKSMTTTECKTFVDLIFDNLQLIKSVSHDSQALENATWSNLLGAKITDHEEKHVRDNAYIYSLTFFAHKWDEKTSWTKDYILKQVELDRWKWPSTRRWRSYTFELEDFNERFFDQQVISRKDNTLKRKRKKDGVTRKVKRSRKNKNESSSNYVEESDRNDSQEIASEDELGHIPSQVGSNIEIQQDMRPVIPLEAEVQNQAGVQAIPPETTSDLNKLSEVMHYILSKGGVTSSTDIDVQNLSKVDSTKFIDKTIQLLSKYGSHDSTVSRTDPLGDNRNTLSTLTAQPDVRENIDEHDEDDDDEMEYRQMVRKKWTEVKLCFSKKKKDTGHLPEPCKGTGLWSLMMKPEDVKPIQEMVCNAIFRSRGAVLTGNEQMKHMVLEMFKEIKSMDLRYQGYTICSGVLKNDETEDWVNSFISYYMKYFNGNGAHGSSRKGGECPWESIANVSTEEDAGPLKKGIGRFQLSSVSDVLHLIQKECRLHIKKLKLEVFVGELVSRIVRSTTKPLRFPSFGSKLLVHTPGTEKQRIHCDYVVLKGGGVLPEEEVKYFAIVTGEKASYLHVMPMGHMEISKMNGDLSQIDSKLVEIPPFSVGLFRGDLPHAGPGADDDVLKRGKFEFAPRVHFYIDRPVDSDTLVFEPSLLFYPQ